ncbi:hypothetical protein ACHQM5_017861 [Ranunculus cassubicifolius]
MEFLASLGTELVKCSASLLHPQIGYLVCYKKINKDLLKKLDDLSKLKADIDVKVNAAKKKGDTISQVVNKWLGDVDDILNDESKVEDSEINNCFKGGCCARHSLGKKASKKIDVVTELLNAPDKWSYFATPVPLQDIEMPTIKDFEAFESTEIAMDKVMKHLKTDQNSIIGVHGMGGIGKTTLMRKIGNQVKATRLFDVVVMVSVSQNQDLKKIQSEIAGELSLDFGQEGVVSRAKRLASRLKQEKSVLIILDDIWMRLDLAEVGIPWGDDHKGCKVVLTTRRKEVCTTMATHADVELECLSDQDAWKLFRANAGKEVDDPSLNGWAKKVAKECKGLPVALVTLGRAMRGKDRSMWEYVHQQLMESNFIEIEDMDAKVFRAIKLSYDYLRDDTKIFFLFCCLFPEDHKISMDELLRYMVGEGIIKESNINRSKRRLDYVVSYLTSSHLLQKGDKSGFVTIHDVIRDVAINIATSVEHGFIVKAGRGLEKWPVKEKLRECKRLSLMGNELSDLPDHPDCPNLLTLALSGCDSLKHMPESFFKGMTSLVNLDISHTPITSLPSSITCLENLRTICLDGCSELRDASLIGKLTTLEVISLEKTSIEILPLNEIANFPNRKLLSKGN